MLEKPRKYRGLESIHFFYPNVSKYVDFYENVVKVS